MCLQTLNFSVFKFTYRISIRKDINSSNKNFHFFKFVISNTKFLLNLYSHKLHQLFFYFRYIDFLYKVLSNNELALLEEKANLIPHTEMGTHFTSSGILAHESLSYLFRVWRMDGEWNSSAAASNDRFNESLT